MEEYFLYITVTILGCAALFESIRSKHSNAKRKERDNVRDYYKSTTIKEQEKMNKLFDFDKTISKDEKTN